MQIKFRDIHYDDKYIYALGEDLLTRNKKHIRISRTDGTDFWCEGDYETVFYRGAAVLVSELRRKNKLSKEESFMWE